MTIAQENSFATEVQIYLSDAFSLCRKTTASWNNFLTASFQFDMT